MVVADVMPAPHDQVAGLITTPPSRRPPEEPRDSALFPHPNTANYQPRRNDEECHCSEDRVRPPRRVEIRAEGQAPGNVEPTEHFSDRHLVHVALLSLLNHLMHRM